MFGLSDPVFFFFFSFGRIDSIGSLVCGNPVLQSFCSSRLHIQEVANLQVCDMWSSGFYQLVATICKTKLFLYTYILYITVHILKVLSPLEGVQMGWV